MPRARSFLLGLAGLAVLAVPCLAAPNSAGEPRVTFALKAGWVEVSMRQDGKPVAGAVLQIVDERGAKFAEGETGPGGETAFPMPAGSSCVVEIKTGTRTADPIRLVKTGSGVEPARVLLSYGLRPCCRSKLIRPEPYSALPPPVRDIAREAQTELERRKFRPLSAPLAALLADPNYDAIPTQAHGHLLQPAPDFTLPEVDGKDWSLARHLQGGPLVLVFYYGYQCNHCVSQLFALDKDIEKFRALGVQVVAVSADPQATTRARYQQYGTFKFPVLADRENKVAEKYEVYVPTKDLGTKGDLLHGTFLINRQGKIVWTNRGAEPFTENRTLLHESARADGRLPAKAR